MGAKRCVSQVRPLHSVPRSTPHSTIAASTHGYRTQRSLNIFFIQSPRSLPLSPFASTCVYECVRCVMCVIGQLAVTAFRYAVLLAKPRTCALNASVFAFSKGRNVDVARSVGTYRHIATRIMRRARDIDDSSRGIAFAV